jgi:two-component system phosphate regulon sensor histidine kinase PhoR
MGWIAFALAALLYLAWRSWRGWVVPSRELEALIKEVEAERTPRTFIVGGNARMRRIALALERLALRDAALRTRMQEREFGVQTIVSALADGLVVADRQRQIRLTNRAFCEIFDLAPEVAGRTLLETVRDATVERLLGETLTRGERQRGEVTRQRSPGPPRFLEVVVEPMKNEAGEVTGAVILFRDITELRQTETMRRDFVANVSHELRTPLSILRGYLETLLENPKQPPSELLRIYEVMARRPGGRARPRADPARPFPERDHAGLGKEIRFQKIAGGAGSERGPAAAPGG